MFLVKNYNPLIKRLVAVVSLNYSNTFQSSKMTMHERNN